MLRPLLSSAASHLCAPSAAIPSIAAMPTTAAGITASRRQKPLRSKPSAAPFACAMSIMPRPLLSTAASPRLRRAARSAAGAYLASAASAHLAPFSLAMTLSIRPATSHLPPPVLHARHLLPSRASLLCPPPHPALPRRGGKSLASASRPRPISPVPCHHTTSAAFHRCQPSSLAICCFPPMPSLCRQCPSCPFLSR